MYGRPGTRFDESWASVGLLLVSRSGRDVVDVTEGQFDLFQMATSESAYVRAHNARAREHDGGVAWWNRLDSEERAGAQ